MISTGVFFQQGFHSTDLVWGGGGGGYRMGKNQACTLEDFTGLAGGVGGGQDGQKTKHAHWRSLLVWLGVGVGVGRGVQHRQKTSMYTVEEFTGLAGEGGGWQKRSMPWVEDSLLNVRKVLHRVC